MLAEVAKWKTSQIGRRIKMLWRPWASFKSYGWSYNTRCHTLNSMLCVVGYQLSVNIWSRQKWLSVTSGTSTRWVVEVNPSVPHDSTCGISCHVSRSCQMKDEWQPSNWPLHLWIVQSDWGNFHCLVSTLCHMIQNINTFSPVWTHTGMIHRAHIKWTFANCVYEYPICLLYV